MTTENKIVWIMRYEHAAYGDVLLRIGRDSEENIALFIASVQNGVQHGTYQKSELNVLTNPKEGAIDALVEGYFAQMSHFLSKDKDVDYEKNWFKIISIANLGEFFVDFFALDKEVTLTTFDQEKQSFWATKYRQEDMYELDLEKYEEDFDGLAADMNEEIVTKLLRKGMYEEDWIM